MTTRFHVEIANARADFQLAIPLHVALGEATDVARAVQQYMSGVKDPHGTLVVPALRSAGPRITPLLADEILELVALSQQAQTGYLLTLRAGGSPELVGRAEEVKDQLEAAIEFVLDDGVQDDHDAQFAEIKATSGSDAIDALALDLDELPALGRELREELGQIEAFDASLLDEAPRLAEALRALPRAGTTSADSKAALALRNRTLAVLQTRLAAARSAARFLYERRHTDVYRQFTSTFERRRRVAAARRAKAAALKKDDRVA